MKKVIAKSLLVASPLFMAGCLETNVEKASIKECQTLENAYRSSSDVPIGNVEDNLKKAQKMAKILFNRTNHAKSRINLGPIQDALMAPDGYAELQSFSSTATLNIYLKNDADKHGATFYEIRDLDHTANFSAGAIACSGAGGLLYPTNFYHTLGLYVDATDQLGVFDKK